MNKTIAAATMAATLTVGGLAGAALGVPGVAGATDPDPITATGAGWVEDALAGLVGDGTITQQQADAVEAALDEARPEHRMRGFRHLGHGVVADVLGITEDELRTALRDGRTVAELAEDRGIEVQAVVDAVVADLEARLAERVDAGDMTRERADQMLERAAERVPAFAEGDTPAFGGGHRRGGR